MVREPTIARMTSLWLLTLSGLALGASPKSTVPLKGAEIDSSTPKRLTRADISRATSKRRFLLQLDGPMTPQRRAVLEQAGVVLGRPVPPDAYIAKIDRVDPAKVASLDFVRWHAPLDPAWKLDPELGVRDHSTPERIDLDRRGFVPVVVTLFSDTSPAELQDVLGAIAALPQASVHRRFLIAGEPAIAATVRFEDLGALAMTDSIQWIEEAPEITERNTSVRWIAQSNIVNQTTLWSNGLTGVGQVVGILDSRIDKNHCAFSDVNPIGPTHRKILAYNPTFVLSAAHGTHVAGTLTGDSGDFSDNRGIAYGAKLVYNLTPSFLESDVFERLSLHHAQGARVHNNSWGNSATSSYDGLSRGVDDFLWRYEDDVVVFAINNGSPASSLTNPENAKNCIAVGASADTPSQDSHCSGGSGPTPDGRRKPDLYAPGCDTVSSAAASGCGTVSFNGTSMATPVVTGLAALTRQYYTDGYYPSGTASSGGFTPSGALVKATLINGCVDMTGIAGYPSNTEGWGRVLADNALRFPADTSKIFIVDRRNAGGMATGDVEEFAFTVNSAAVPLRATLVWTDPPAAAGAAMPSVNNLDLEVIAPDNTTVYIGNAFVGGESTVLQPADTKNNVEQVHRLTPGPGVWKARINATAVNESYQGFALVVTGDIVTPPTPLIIAPASLPTMVEPGRQTSVEVSITGVGQTITPASPTLHYRTSPGPFQTAALSPLGDGKFRGSLPPAPCGGEIEYYFSAAGSITGVETSPSGAPGSTYSAVTGTVDSTTLLSANFESGLPAGWSTTGLWHVTTSCAQSPACDGIRWAYFGLDGACDYDNGPGRVFGSLTAPLLALPSINPGEKLTLSFCSSLGRESYANVDFARVRVNLGVVLDLGAASTAWTNRTIDLTSFAGQNVTIDWIFDSVDGFDNTYLGWQVDNIRLERQGVVCIPPTCQADVNGDTNVNGLDLSVLLSNFGAMGATLSQGDINGDTQVNGGDLSVLLSEFGNTCN